MSLIVRPSAFAVCLLLIGVVACSSDSPSMPTRPSPADGFSIGIENEPCVASANGSLSCQFVVLPVAKRNDSGLVFGWRIENPANGRASQGGAAWSSFLPIPCEMAPGVARFDVVVKLSVYSYGLDNTGTVTRSVVITRAPGACGT